MLSTASTVGPPQRDTSQPPAQHGSLIPDAELQRGKAQSVLELSLHHWMAHKARRRSLGGLGVLSSPLWAAGWGCRKVLRGAEGVPGGVGRCWAPSPSDLLPPRRPRDCQWLGRSGTLTLAQQYLLHLRLGVQPLRTSTQFSSRPALPPDKGELTALLLAGWKFGEVFKPAGLDEHGLKQALYLILSSVPATLMEGRGCQPGQNSQ